MHTNLSRTLTLLTLSAAATSTFAASGSFARTLSVNGAPTISISTGSGFIHVTTGK